MDRLLYRCGDQLHQVCPGRTTGRLRAWADDERPRTGQLSQHRRVLGVSRQRSPYDYITRAEELLSQFNKAIDWEKFRPLPEDNVPDEPEPEDIEEVEMTFENPSPMSFSWHTYKDLHFGCKHCSWQGAGEYLEFGEEFDQLIELDCPSCHTKVTFVMYPTLADSRANWDRLSDAEKAQVESLENARANFVAASLKTPQQLPEIAEPSFSLAWDIDGEGEITLLRLGDRVIFSEPAMYEGFERFEKVARILKQRYGAALRDLVPTPGSETYLYGDSLTASGQVTRFRQTLFCIGKSGDLFDGGAKT